MLFASSLYYFFRSGGFFMSNRRTQTMDGNTAAAYISYPFTEVAAIFPITPSSPMAELTDAWAA